MMISHKDNLCQRHNNLRYQWLVKQQHLLSTEPVSHLHLLDLEKTFSTVVSDLQDVFTYTMFSVCLFVLTVPCGLQDLSSWNRVWTWGTAVKAPSPNHWTTREFPTLCFYLFIFLFIYFFSYTMFLIPVPALWLQQDRHFTSDPWPQAHNGSDFVEYPVNYKMETGPQITSGFSVQSSYELSLLQELENVSELVHETILLFWDHGTFHVTYICIQVGFCLYYT